ncbi:Hypothetical protein CINCED_3A018366 [Cinara cedri]|uniref:Uncharacterized protein n=1 Tax=Cinara cedri TaxID=506608 RepID=A0A5E4MN29_9HEMI|nr:Hypothetical protein CINCED_3A018366 [Cinara cedri]
MRIISECVKSTKLEWLPVLSHIAPPEVRRHSAELKMIEKYKTLQAFQYMMTCITHQTKD